MSVAQIFDRVVWSTCNVNCGSRCPVRLFVKDGRVVRIEPDNTGEQSSGPHEIRACLRGRGLRQWVYSKERLLYPLQRVGKRGEGRFERISWSQALDIIAAELGRIIEQYGNEAVFRIYGTGNVGVPGGNSGDREAPFGIAFPGIPMGENPVKTSIPCFMWTRAIDDPANLTTLNSGLLGKERLAAPIKFIWSFASNTLVNQHSDINRTKKILSDEKKCEMVVVIPLCYRSRALCCYLLRYKFILTL